MKMLLAFFVCLLALAPAPADEEKPKAKVPTPADYEKVLKYFNEWSDNLTNPDHWKDVTFTNKKTKKVRKFSDLSEYEKQIYYFMSAEKLSNELKRMDGYWQAELKKFEEKKEEGEEKKKEEGNDEKKDAKPDKEEKKETDPKKLPATKAQVEQYYKDLVAVRKKTAVRFEAQAEKLFKDYKDKFTDEEREQIMRQIRDFHDKDKLIERAKK